MDLYITSRLGLVHRMEHGVTCTSGRNANVRRPVTKLQCLAYKLPPCNAPVCFPARDQFALLIRSPR